MASHIAAIAVALSTIAMILAFIVGLLLWSRWRGVAKMVE
jgi:hypothetical protein